MQVECKEIAFLAAKTYSRNDHDNPYRPAAPSCCFPRIRTIQRDDKYPHPHCKSTHDILLHTHSLAIRAHSPFASKYKGRILKLCIMTQHTLAHASRRFVVYPYVYFQVQVN